MLISRRTFLRTGIVAGGGLLAAGTYGVTYERHRLSVTRANLPVANLLPALAGVRIGILTDIHHSRLVSQRDVLDAAEMLMSERPDVIALLGDYITWGDRKYIDSCAEALGVLAAPCGVFAILGNHDDERLMPRALGKLGFDVLLDSRTTTRIRGESVTIAGLRYWTKRQADIERLVRGTRGRSVLLAHDPRRLTEASAAGVPLLLSGHTHGGQVVLPLIGAVAAQKFPVSQGMTRQGNTTLFVSRGIGTVVVPIRLNCPPEVAVLTLVNA